MNRVIAASAIAVAFAWTSAAITQIMQQPEVRAAHNAASKDRQLDVRTKEWKGDFDAMLERRIVRVAAPYSRSLFYIDKGRERGLGAELVRDFEQWINKKYAKQLGKRPVTMYITAVTRDKLLPDLTSGHADIAIGHPTA